jgi:hypothetical protein
MSRQFVSPMGDPTFATAATSLAEALFPNSRKRAAAAMAGAQYRGQQLGNAQTELENEALYDENAAWAGGAEGTGMTPEQFNRARLGRSAATPSNLADAIAKDLEMGFRRAAVDRAAAGDWTGANAQMVGVASGPVAVNTIDEGYQLNQFEAGGVAAPTGQTLAEIVSEQALAGARGAAANASNARAGYYTERTRNPERFRASGGGAGSEVSPSEVKALDDLVSYYLPAATPSADGAKLDTVVEDGLRNAVLTRAAALYRTGGDAQAAVAQAVDELMDIQPGTPGEDGILWDDEGTPARVTRKQGQPVEMIDPPPPNVATTSPEQTLAEMISGIEADAGRPLTPAERAQVRPDGNFTLPVPPAAAAPRAPIAKIPPSQWDAALAEANAAIAKGADPAAVRQRLLEMGVQLQDEQ